MRSTTFLHTTPIVYNTRELYTIQKQVAIGISRHRE